MLKDGTQNYAPVQGRDRIYRIPWRIHAKAAKVYNDFGHGQTAERLAERGGFGLEELILLLAGENPYSTPPEEIRLMFKEPA